MVPRGQEHRAPQEVPRPRLSPLLPGGEARLPPAARRGAAPGASCGAALCYGAGGSRARRRRGSRGSAVRRDIARPFVPERRGKVLGELVGNGGDGGVRGVCSVRCPKEGPLPRVPVYRPACEP